MDLPFTYPFLIVAALALAFCFSNGYNDSSGLVATMISTHAMSPERALLIATLFELIGALCLGTAVAKTMMGGLVDMVPTASVSGGAALAAALVAALIWNFLTARLGLPSSSSHTLIGGLVGAALAAYGPESVHWHKLGRVVAALVVSPVMGFFAAYVFIKLSTFLCQWVGPRINQTFNRIQVVSSCLLALSHGTNDAQKTMGVLTLALALMVPGHSAVGVPDWVQKISAVVISLGVLFGGLKLIKTLGFKLYKVRPLHGFAAQSMSAGVLAGMTYLGFPLSSTQVMSSALLGAGSAERPKAIRWSIAGDMLITWIVTLPASGLLAFGLVHLGGVVHALIS